MTTSRFSLALGLCALPQVLAAQAVGGDDGVRVVRTLDGAVSFAIPASWRALPAGTGDMAFVYHIRNPAADTIAGVRTNVLVDVEQRSGRREFAAYSDTLLGRWITPEMLVLDDTTVGHQRAVFWRGEIGETVFAGFDDVAQVDSVWVHVRIIVPLVASPEGWSARVSKDTGALLQSVLVHRQRAFPVSVGYPALMPRQPDG